MSNYSNPFGGAAKDTANSTVLGADHDTQYEAIATMSSTKLDTSGLRAAVEAASDSNVFTDADHTKLNTLSSPVAAAANHIRLGREYLIDGTITTSTSDVAATATEDTFRTYGKTGASTVLSSMNTYVPSEATGVILDVQLVVTAQSGNNAVLSFNACSADLSPIAGDSNRVGFANAYESSAPSGALTRSGSMTRVVVPLNSSGIFKATFKQTTTYERSCVIYYRGYVTD